MYEAKQVAPALPPRESHNQVNKFLYSDAVAQVIVFVMVWGGIPFVQLVMVRSVGGLIPPRFESAITGDQKGSLLGTYNGHCQSFCETTFARLDLLVAPLTPPVSCSR
jgi:hypothetical protein